MGLFACLQAFYHVGFRRDGNTAAFAQTCTHNRATSAHMRADMDRRVCAHTRNKRPRITNCVQARAFTQVCGSGKQATLDPRLPNNRVHSANVGLARPALHLATLPEETAFHDCFEETAVSGMTPPSVADTDEEEVTDAGRVPPGEIAPILVDSRVTKLARRVLLPLLLHTARRLAAGMADEWLGHCDGGALAPLGGRMVAQAHLGERSAARAALEAS